MFYGQAWAGKAWLGQAWGRSRASGPTPTDGWTRIARDTQTWTQV